MNKLGAILVLVLALCPRGAGGAVDLNAELEQRILGADSARVVRLREPISGESGPAGDDRLDDFIVERLGSTDGAWKKGMAKTLTDAIRRFPVPQICPRQSGPRRIKFGVQFFHGDGRTTLVLYPAERCFEFWTGRRFEGSAELHDLTPAVLALVKRAFPTDTTVRHLDIAGTITCDDYAREHPGEPLIEHPPEATLLVPPSYPKDARKAKIEGLVMVRVKVGADGAVSEPQVMQSVPGLDTAAVETARQWRFEPALDCRRRPVATWVVIPIRFRLD